MGLSWSLLASPVSRCCPREVEHLPGSKATYTKGEINDLFVVPDWYPDIHPPMPDIVAHGRKPEVYACGHCHLPNGQGRPENASVTGLPAEYIVQQMADFKSGLRKGSDPDMLSVTNMIKLAKSVSDEDVKAAAAYFSSFQLKPWIHVVEVEEVPKTKPAGGMMVVEDGAEKEPIGDRVIEVSENLEQTELRDPTSGFIAYVPKGSLAKGKDSGHDRRQWKNDGLHHVSRPEPEGNGKHSLHRRPLPQPDGAADHRLPKRIP